MQTTNIGIVGAHIPIHIVPLESAGNILLLAFSVCVIRLATSWQLSFRDQGRVSVRCALPAVGGGGNYCLNAAFCGLVQSSADKLLKSCLRALKVAAIRC